MTAPDTLRADFRSRVLEPFAERVRFVIRDLSASLVLEPAIFPSSSSVLSSKLAGLLEGLTVCVRSAIDFFSQQSVSWFISTSVPAPGGGSVCTEKFDPSPPAERPAGTVRAKVARVRKLATAKKERRLRREQQEKSSGAGAQDGNGDVDMEAGVEESRDVEMANGEQEAVQQEEQHRQDRAGEERAAGTDNFLRLLQRANDF